MSIINANWIKAGESMGDVVPVFSKVIEVCDPEKAEISVSAKGVYCLYINGKRVSDYVLAPGWTMYEKRLQYQTYDVTNMLKNGENKIEIGVGFGWMMHNKTFKDVKMIASIEKVLKDSGDKVSDADKETLNKEVESAKEVYKNSDDIEKLKAALESLTKVSNDIFTKLYQQANPNGANPNGDNNGGANTDPNNFTDFKTE